MEILELTSLISQLEKLISLTDQRLVPGYVIQDSNPQILVSIAVNGIITLPGHGNIASKQAKKKKRNSNSLVT